MIRRATWDDIQTIYDIELACFSTPWSMEALETELTDTEKRLYLVMEDEAGQAVGYAGAWMVCDEGQITNIAVVPTAQRQGFGGRLTRKLVQELWKRGMTEIFLEVRVSNMAALAMYRRLGFTVKGLRKGYYEAPVEDAYLMSLVKEETL